MRDDQAAPSSPDSRSTGAHSKAAPSIAMPKGRNGQCRLTILGATGSIGTSTLDLIASNPDAYDILTVSAHTNAVELAQIARTHNARRAVICDPAQYQALKDALSGSGIEAAAGDEALVDAASEPSDCVMAAIVGAAGLRPAFAALGATRRLALANKECLVSAGDVFMAAVARTGTELLPVDSEHSAAFQALGAAEPGTIEMITLTASGGPFRAWTFEQIQGATLDQALKHPNWSMGAKITVDSATMMNKGLELIEAYHLFPVSADQLGVVVHPQSIIHCLVSYRDGSVLAQLSEPDMRVPISLALAWPDRMTTPTKRLDLAAIGTLTFEPPDETRFPALRIARQALHNGGAAPTVLNAANEVAVAAFLNDKLPFKSIAHAVEETMQRADKEGVLKKLSSLEDVLACDAATRRLADVSVSALR